MLAVAYEQMNRKFICNVMAKFQHSSQSEISACYKENYDELKAAVEAQYPKDKERMVKRMDTATQIYCILGYYRKNDKVFDESVKKVIKKHPNLDYAKTVDRVVFGKDK